MTRSFRQLFVLVLLSTSGCALFSTGRNELILSQERLRPDQAADFAADHPIRRVVRLDTSIVSALATDRRMREVAWEELDESGLMSPAERRRLNQSGLRVGVSGGTLPWALESLLRGERVNSESAFSSARLGDHSTSFGSHVAIPQGSNSIIELSAEDHSLVIPAGRIAGMNKGGELDGARCVLEMTATEYGDGWVVIRFLPQLHHGSRTMRYSISESGEKLPIRQRIQPLYEQQFEVKLHTNETLVIGYQMQDDWTVGRLLFQSDSLTSKTERLLAIQLTQIEEVAGQKSMDVSYSKY